MEVDALSPLSTGAIHRAGDSDEEDSEGRRVSFDPAGSRAPSPAPTPKSGVGVQKPRTSARGGRGASGRKARKAREERGGKQQFDITLLQVAVPSFRAFGEGSQFTVRAWRCATIGCGFGVGHGLPGCSVGGLTSPSRLPRCDVCPSMRLSHTKSVSRTKPSPGKSPADTASFLCFTNRYAAWVSVHGAATHLCVSGPCARPPCHPSILSPLHPVCGPCWSLQPASCRTQTACAQAPPENPQPEPKVCRLSAAAPCGARGLPPRSPR